MNKLGVFLKLNKNTGKQVIFFPHLGGSSTSFMKLAHELDKKGQYELVSANPPGHGGSNKELISNLDELLDFYSVHIKDILKEGSVFLGHSMGGIVAYYLAHKLMEDENSIKPELLILSATPPPVYMKDKNMSKKEDSFILKNLEALGGLPNEIVDNSELSDYFLPIFRADYKILEDASLIKKEAINIKTGFICSYNDKIASANSLFKWKEYISAKCMVSMMPPDAGHMFINTQPKITANIVDSYINAGWDDIK